MATRHTHGPDGRVIGGLRLLLDSYSRRARLAPVIVAMLPALALMAGGVFALEAEARVTALLLGTAGLVACALVRDAGHRAQSSLWREWGGSSTLRRMRFSDSDRPQRVARLHARLELVLGVELPTAEEEAADPEAADDRYDDTISDLRQLTRTGDDYKVLAAENADYGFRRNLYGIRPVGLAVAGVCSLVAVFLILMSTGTVEQRVVRWGPAALVGIVWLGLFGRVVTSAWVRLAGERYADRLLEAARSLVPSTAPSLE